VAAVLLGRLPGGLMYLSRRPVARALAFLRTGPRPVELPPVRLSPAGRALAARVQAARGTR